MVECELTQSKEVKYRGKIFTVEQHQVLLPNGQNGTRDIVLHNGAVAIIALTDDYKEMVFVKQYRKGVERTLIEIPAGLLDRENEEPIVAAKRELLEETQYEAERVEKLVEMTLSPGYLSETITLFVAMGLSKNTKTDSHLDEDECVECLVLNRQQVAEYMQSGDICDAKTLYAVQYWDLLVQRGLL